MELARRFVFHGHACAYSGRLYRPKDLVIASPASAAISVSGGASKAEGKRQRFGTFLSVGPSAASAVGAFDDRKMAVAMSNHLVGEEALASTTSAHAEVNDVLSEGKRIRIKQIRASLVAQQPVGRNEPEIRIGRQSGIRGVEIDGYTLQVTLDAKPFDEAPTFDAFVKIAAGRSALLYERHGSLIASTLAAELKWRGKPHPNATIEGHGVHVPGLGWIYFGEVLVERWARRVTMVRFRLGSPTGMHVSFADVGTNGSWYPPIT